MPKGLFNWKFSNVEKFLKENYFVITHTRGSHFYFLGQYGGEIRNVCVPFHGSKIIKTKTLKSIIFQSGIPKEKWIGNRK